jgi:glucose/arabinose dehydrogenase
VVVVFKTLKPFRGHLMLSDIRSDIRFRLALVIAAGVVVAGMTGIARAAPAIGQRGAAPAAQIPTGRTGRGGYPLPVLPAVFETFQHTIRVSVVARGLDRPWSLLILPDGDMLVSMRYAREIRAIRKGVLDPRPVTGLPAMRRIFDLVMHPEFDQNRWIYFSYSKPGDGRTPMVLARGRYDGAALTDVQDLYVSDPTTQGGSRVAFAPDGSVYMTVSGAAGRIAAGPAGPEADPRKLDTAYGKVVRVRDDGLVPPDNPFVGKPGARPEIYSVGHRDHFGIAPHPATGQMFHVELGPYGGDKVNILKAGADYGWPDYSYGRNNDSSPIANPNVPGIEPALLVWVPGITPSGLLFYTGDRFPAWKGNLMVGSVVRGRTNGATGVERVVFNDRMWETRRETFLAELKQRIRDIRQGRDGLIYLLTEEVDGAILKIEPVN